MVRIIIVTILILVFLIVNANPALAAVCPGGMDGSNTTADPCIITNVTQLQNMSQNLSASYALGNDIDASATSTWNGGAGFNPVGTFTGRLDGQGYNITGLYIYRTGTDYVGLFGYVSAANISNLSLVSVNITGYRYVGAIIGSGSANINNTFSTGTVTATGTSAGGLIGTLSGSTSLLSISHSTVNVIGASTGGGLLGYLDSGKVRNSYASGNVTCSGYTCGGLIGANNANAEINSSYATGNVSGMGSQFGGFVGQNYGTIRNSYSRGSVSQRTGNIWEGLIGGFADYNDGSIINSYSTGFVSNGSTNGFALRGNTPICTNIFWDNQTSGKTTSDSHCSATGKTTAQMKNVSTFTNISSAWDFFGDPYNDTGVNDYWNINSTYNDGYPYLTWQIDLTGPGITINTPADGSSTSNQTPQLYATFGGETVLYAWYNLNNTGNSTPIANTDSLTVTLPSLPEGAHNVTVYANDSAGNLNSSIVYFTVDVTPTLTFLSPTPANNSNTNTSIKVNVSIVESNIISLLYNWNGTNYTMYNDSLLLMLNFENFSSLGENSTYAVDMSRNAQNLSCANPNCPTLNSTGRYGKAYTFDGIDDVFKNTATSLNFAAGQPHSIELWLQASSSSDKYFIDLGTDPGSSGKYTEHMYAGAGRNVVMDLRQTWAGNGVGVSSTTTLSSNTWYHVVGVNTGSVIKIYLNGILEGTTNLGAFSSYPLTGNNVRIGSGDVNWNSYFNGSIDEVRIWNRSLSSEEVYQQYVSNLQKFNSTQWYLYVNQSKNTTANLDEGTYTYQTYATDIAGNNNQTERTVTVYLLPPVITINTPVNGSTTNDTTPELNATFGGATVAYAWYNVNNTGNSTPVANTNNLTVTLLPLPDGVHSVTVYANDSAGNLNSSVVYFTVDATPPNVPAITVPSDSSTLTSSTTWINGTMSADTANITVYVNGAITNDSIAVSGTTFNISNVPLGANGVHEINVSAKDAAGNVNTTNATVTVTVDAIAPILTFLSPTPANNTNTTNTSIEINASITELNLNSLIYNWNFTNFTMYNDSLVLMLNFDNVSALGENSTEVVDLSRYGNNGTVVNGSTWNSSGKYGGAYQFNGINNSISVNRSILNNMSRFTLAGWIYPLSAGPRIGFFGQNEIIEFGFNSATSIQGWTSGGGDVSWSFTPGTFLNSWHFVAFTGNGANLRLYIDGVGRSVAGTSTTNYGNSTDPFNIGAAVWDPAGNNFNGTIDEVQVWNRSLSADEIYLLYASNLRKYNSTQWYLYVNQSKNATASLDDGIYTYQTYATDPAGNNNQTERRTITVDTTLPVVTFVSPTPANNSNQSQTYIQTNVSVSDTNFKNVTTYIYYGNGTLRTSITNTSSPALNNFTGLSDGSYIINATSYDWSNNSNNSESRNITTAIIRLVVTINAPSNGSTTSDPTPELNATFGGETVAYAWYNVNNTVNSTPVANTDNLTVTLSTLPDGAHNVTVYANDSAGNLNSTIVYFTVDAAAPVVTASKNYSNYTQINPMTIDSNITVTDADSNVTGARVSIGDGYVISEDYLNYTTTNGITGSYSTTTGILTLTGNRSGSDYQAAFRNVSYWNSNTNNPNTSQRNITFAIGNNSLYYPGTGHYYEYVSLTLTWTNAKTAADAKTFYGLQGYLVTINSSEENTFILEKVSGDVWIGASDSAVEGDWKWVTGPEAGTLFYRGTGASHTTFGYDNWASDEPNDASNEDVAEMYSTGGGTWNDLSGTSPLSYLVEYGGMAGDPTLHLTAMVIVNVTDIIPPTAPTINVPANVATLTSAYTWVNGTTSADTANVTIYVNGSITNASVTVSGNIFNISNVPLGADGIHEINVSAMDTAGNVNTTNATVIVTVDAIAPSTTIISPVNTTYSTTSIILDVTTNQIANVTYSLNGGTNLSFYNLAISGNTTITGIEGSNNVTVYANDTAGNLNSSIVYFTVYTTSPDTSHTSSGGGGSGGGGVITAEPSGNIASSEMIERNLVAGKDVTYTFTKNQDVVYEVSFLGKENENNVAMRIEILKDISKQVTESAPGLVYRNVNIIAGTKKIGENVIKFKVKDSWLVENGFDSSDIRLVKWVDNKLIILETGILNSEDGYTHFSAKSLTFSIYAITGIKKGESMQAPSTTEKIAVTPEATPLTTEEPTPQPEGKTPVWVWMIPAVLLFGALVYALKRK